MNKRFKFLITGLLMLCMYASVNAQLNSTNFSLPFNGLPGCALCGQTDYAGSDGTGNWGSGIKTFSDPLPSGASIVAIYIYVDYAGNCTGSGNYTLYFNGNAVNSTPQSGNCSCSDICRTNTFYPDTNDYVYSGSNSIQVIDDGITMYVAKYRVLLVYDENTAPPPSNNHTMNVNGCFMEVGPSAYVVAGGNILFQNSGAIEDSGVIKVRNNWVNNGTGLINSRPGTVEFDGTSAQTIGGNTATNFYNLTINNSVGVSLDTNVNVENALTFTSGILTASSDTLGIVSNPPFPITGASTTSYVDGNLKVAIPSGNTTYTYEVGGGGFYAPSILAINGVTIPGSITGLTAPGASPNENNPVTNASGIDQSNKADQYWILNNNGAAFSYYDVTFDFTNTINTGITSNYVVRKFDAPSTWSATTSSVTGLTIQATGLTNFSEFAVGIGGCMAPGIIPNVTHVSCTGAGDGSIALSIAGGSSPFTFLWSNGSTDQNISSLSGGSYSVTVTANGGCTASSLNILVNEPSTLIASGGGSHITCNGNNDGTATVSISGGSSPFIYLWSNGATTSSLSSLSPGAYSVTVTDNCSLTSSSSFTVTEPAAFSVSCGGTGITCNGNGNGTASASASGGTSPYSYAWSNSATTASISSLSQGTYSVTVTDNSGCTGVCSYSVIEPAVLSASVSVNTPVCAGNDINLTSTVTGGTIIYNYSWTGPNAFSSTDANPSIVSAVTANSGTYSLVVTDANGCIASASDAVTVNICSTTLNLNVYIQGYYLGGGQMQPVVLNENVFGATGAETDTITVELRDSGTPIIILESAQAVLMTDGTASAVFSGTVAGNTYWIAVKHRNTVQGWSISPFTFNPTPTSSYDFTTSPTTTYGSNVIQVNFGPDLWAFYNGDINQDENVDLLDFPSMDYDINNGIFGYYSTDLNGDGNVDLLDFPVLDANINNGVFSSHP